MNFWIDLVRTASRIKSPIAAMLPPGAISAPFTNLSSTEYGNLSTAQMRTFSPNQTTPMSAVALSEARLTWYRLPLYDP